MSGVPPIGQQPAGPLPMFSESLMHCAMITKGELLTVDAMMSLAILRCWRRSAPRPSPRPGRRAQASNDPRSAPNPSSCRGCRNENRPPPDQPVMAGRLVVNRLLDDVAALGHE